MIVPPLLVRSLFALLGASLSNLAGYMLLAGSAWLFFHVAFRARLRHRRISNNDPTAAQIRREIRHSLRSIVIFSLVTGVVVYVAYLGWTRLYLDVNQHGWGWFFLSIGLMILLHDTYFYWTHRLMHLPPLFRWFHRTHHLSVNPTPWAAYAFSPMEALIQAGIGPLLVFTMPVHAVAFVLFMAFQIVFNVFGHCGHEIFPQGFLKSRAGLLLNSVTHHALHHEKYTANFGLYFNVWDRLMKTNHRDYEKRFELATSTLPSGTTNPTSPF